LWSNIEIGLLFQFNEVYQEFFKHVAPARSCMAVERLPKDVLVEIEAIAVV